MSRLLTCAAAVALAVGWVDLASAQAAKTALISAGELRMGSSDLQQDAPFGPPGPVVVQRAAGRPVAAAEVPNVTRGGLFRALSDTGLLAERLVAEVPGGSRDAVRKLLDEGASPDAVNAKGQSALTEAIRHDHVQIVRLLLERGAHPDLGDRTGHTPLTLAIARERDDLVEQLLRAGASSAPADSAALAPLVWAASLDRPRSIDQLMRAGAASRTKPSTGPALHACARTGALRACERLLDWGADPVAVDKSGQSAVMLASQRQDDAMLALLRAPRSAAVTASR